MTSRKETASSEAAEDDASSRKASTPSEMPDEELNGDVSSGDDEPPDGPDGLDLVPSAPRDSRQGSARRQADQAIFDLWVDKRVGQGLQFAEGKASSGPGNPGNPGTQSVASLVRASGGTKIIQSPRDYQVELFERAKQRNIIAVLDTGSGKTLIAAMLLRHVIERELADRARGEPKRTAFFLVDKVALVHQQYAVLECNLGYKMEKFFGSSASNSPDRWGSILAENMVIVLTADILLQCLFHSYISMRQINLLIFDEAHHTKKNHPYARIVKDFYASDEQRREPRQPRIFGMTASPVDDQTSITKAAQDLEALLHSEIATVADPAVLRASGGCRKKEERFHEYRLEHAATPTALSVRLTRLVGHHAHLRKRFAFAAAARRELGPWCVDRFWQIVLQPDELAKLEAKTQSDPSRSWDLHVSALDELREAGRLVADNPLGPPDPTLLSDKVASLHRSLSEHFQKPGAGRKMRCIVFVDQRNTAMMLADLFQQPSLDIANLRASPLVGGDGSDTVSSTIREQLVVLAKFRDGDLNCLFATSVAEEGLDIPECNLIIRFDLYKTLIQYIQSRGRARHENSIYIHMIEVGNRLHARVVAESQSKEEALRLFCQGLPDDRKLLGNDVDLASCLEKDRRQKRLLVPGTNALLTYQSSLLVLANFVASLPRPSGQAPPPADYTLVPGPNGGFVGEVTMPQASPIRTAVGREHARKQVAKCAAAFEMCVLLLKAGYLTAHLEPVFAKQLPALRNARLAIRSKDRSEYPMRTKPRLWVQLAPPAPAELFATVLTLARPAAMHYASRPLVLLTRRPLPRLQPFSLFFAEGRVSEAQCIPLRAPLRPDPADLDALTAFTLRLFHHVFSKEYEGSASDLPYFLAPAAHGHSYPFEDNQEEKEEDDEAGKADPVASLLDWACLRLVARTDRLDYGGLEPDAFFTDKFVADPLNGSRKFFLQRVRRDMTALDPVPDGVPLPVSRAWRKGTVTRDILHYSAMLWSSSPMAVRAAFRADQPVVEARLASLRRNLLDDRFVDADDSAEPATCFLVLQPLRISPLPPDVAAMAFNIPAVMHRLDSTLIALEACERLGLDGIRPELALEAVTKDSENSGEEGDNQAIDFQGGMGRNYERLEFLGDCFLKMATTISTYCLGPDMSEFELHVERMCLVCNKNLFNKALAVGLPEYIRTLRLQRGSWYPEVARTSSDEKGGDAAAAAAATAAATAEPAAPGLRLKSGKLHKIARRHTLGGKTIADVCEAFIGAAYLSGPDSGGRNLDLAAAAVTAVVGHKNHEAKRYADYYAAYAAPAWQTGEATPAQQDMAARVAEQTGYAFGNPRLLRSAFTHPSYPRVYENLPSYQRLEFLGDALLDMAVVDFLFSRFPDKDPQWLTEHKMAMASNQFLAVLSVALGFHRHVLSFSAPMQAQTAAWVADVAAARARAEDEAVAAGRTRADFAPDYWVRLGQPPKWLADVVEAYVGAIFVDSAFDYGAVRDFFRRHVQPFFEDLAAYDTYAANHPVTLAAHTLARAFGCQAWRCLVREVAAEDSEAVAAAAAADADNTATRAEAGRGEGEGEEEEEEQEKEEKEEGELKGGDSGGGGETKTAAGFLVHGRVMAHGFGASARYAKLAAARMLLAKLDGLSLDEFQALTGCDCKPPAEEERELGGEQVGSLGAA